MTTKRSSPSDGVAYAPNEFTIAGRYRLRGLDAGLFLERFHPGELGAYGVSRVISGSVHTQDKRLRGFRIINTIGSILRDVQKRQARPRRHVPVAHGVRCNFAEMANTLDFAQ